VFIPDDNGVITQVVSSPLKQKQSSNRRHNHYPMPLAPGYDGEVQDLLLTYGNANSHDSEEDQRLMWKTFHILMTKEKI
jgi:hypothetical protein